MKQSPVFIPNNGDHSVLPTRPVQNVVPPTPAPRTIDTIQNDARERFGGILWIQKDPNQPMEDYFMDYDYWEKYSEAKPYSKRIYQAAFKGVMREYQNYLCILNMEQNEEYYVLAKHIRNELETLAPYCPCPRCVSYIFNPMKYIWCPN